MPFAAGIKFSNTDFSEYFNPGDLDLTSDEFCIVYDKQVDVERVGLVSTMEGRAPIQMGHLPHVIRKATEEEAEEWYNLQIREAEALRIVRERAKACGLSIKVSRVTIVSERQQILVHFTSEARIDFRELVRDLAGHFKARIEMWQVGARKEAGMQGGMGVCGNKLCCSNWIKDFPSVAMRHAKEQDIMMPPSKLSGPCNKLRCCLRYEHEQYVEMATGSPATGCKGCASDGACGVVIDRNLIKEEVRFRPEQGDIRTIPFSEFHADKDDPRAPKRPAVAVPINAEEDDFYDEPDEDKEWAAFEKAKPSGPVVVKDEPTPASNRGNRPASGSSDEAPGPRRTSRRSRDERGESRKETRRPPRRDSKSDSRSGARDEKPAEARSESRRNDSARSESRRGERGGRPRPKPKNDERSGASSSDRRRSSSAPRSRSESRPAEPPKQESGGDQSGAAPRKREKMSLKKDAPKASRGNRGGKKTEGRGSGSKSGDKPSGEKKSRGRRRRGKSE